MTDTTVEPDSEQPEGPTARKSLREREAELNARASLLDTEVELTFWETVRVIARTWAFIRYFKGRFAVKWVLNLGALMFPVFVLPWGVKIVVDHVVLGREIAGTQGYPGWLHPLILWFQGMPPMEIMGWLTLIGITLVVLVGAYGPGAANDTTDGGMAEGQATATKQAGCLQK